MRCFVGSFEIRSIFRFHALRKGSRHDEIFLRTATHEHLAKHLWNIRCSDDMYTSGVRAPESG